jgi:Zn-dependent protease with chaperone function
MTKTFTTLLLIFISIYCIQAQESDDYILLKSEGVIPINLLKSSTQKYEEDKASTTSKQKTERQFYLENNFVLDQLLQSGQLLFNDPISIYVQDILAVVLKDEEELKKKLSVYTVKSASVNAFATDRGEIFVNLGLITKLESEAQLAFILCHEIQHYAEKHNLNSFVYNRKIDKGEEMFRSEKSYDKVLAKHSYNRDLEREADKLGYKLFKKAGYLLEDALGVFDILGFAHTPYQEEEFTFDWLEIGNITLGNNLYLEEVDSIKIEDDEDELSTHPSVLDRKGKLREWLQADKEIKGNRFIVSETDFLNVRKIARFEICNILVSNRSYSAAIYHSFLLLKKYPKNKYLRTCVAKSLYGLAQYKNDDRLDELYYEHDKIQGEMQRAFYLFEKLDKEDLNTLAIRYCWELFREYPNDAYIKYSTKDLVEDLVIYGVEDIDKYYDKIYLAAESAIDLQVEILSPERQQGRKPSSFSILDIWEEVTFQEYIANGKRYKKKFEERVAKTDKEYRQEQLKGKSLGIDNVIFINPFYLHVNLLKDRVDYLYSEEKQSTIKEYIEKNAKKLDLEVNVLDMQNLDSSMKASYYNEIVIIDNWVNELLEHNMYMICSNYNEVLPLTEKYNTNHFAYTGVYTARKSSIIPNIVDLALIGMIFTAPVGVFNSVTKNKESVYFTFVFDFKSHSIVLRDSNGMKINDKPAVIKSNLYWSMMQMKRASKKKTK